MDGVALKVGNGGGLLELFAGARGGELVEEGRQEVRVVDVDGELGEDVAESQLGLLQAVEGESVLASQKGTCLCLDLHLRGELALLIGSHECGSKTERAQSQVALRALAGIVDEGNSGSVVLLVVVLVLDEAEVDKVAERGAGVESDVVGIDVDLLQVTDHLVLVDNVGLLARSGSGGERAVALVALGGSAVDGGEGEGVCDFERLLVVHADDGSSSSRREASRAVSGNLHDDLLRWDSRLALSLWWGGGHTRHHVGNSRAPRPGRSGWTLLAASLRSFWRLFWS